jgi:hypothetical protein
MPKHILLLISIYLILLPIPAQAQEEVQLQIRLRYSDGTAVFGETVILERLPEEEPVPWAANDDALRQAQDEACTTDAVGECAWSVTPGLYQVLFTRPLDDLSALAVAEGGLSGFGLTVGDEDIAYYFTFHSYGQVYFDAAPNADVPSPIIPDPDDLHMPALPTEPYPAEAATPPPSSVSVTNTEVAAPDHSWRLFLFVIRGLTLGITLHFLRPFLGRAWSRVRANTEGIRPKTPEENKDA